MKRRSLEGDSFCFVFVSGVKESFNCNTAEIRQPFMRLIGRRKNHDSNRDAADSLLYGWTHGLGEALKCKINLFILAQFLMGQTLGCFSTQPGIVTLCEQ